MDKKQVLGIVRHVLTFAGGYAAAQGYADDATVQQVVAGVVALVGVIWSIVDKRD